MGKALEQRRRRAPLTFCDAPWMKFELAAKCESHAIFHPFHLFPDSCRLLLTDRKIAHLDLAPFFAMAKKIQNLQAPD